MDGWMDGWMNERIN